jgi:hypothetical protein
MRRLLGALLVALVALLAVPGVAAAEGGYSAPVDEPIVDPFRPPPTPYAAGNRGIDYATTPGEAVLAAADGEVVFAGKVGLSQHVVVLHADGIRTSYSFLSGVGVRRGDRVQRGDVVGTAGNGLHFGARLGDDTYLDPTTLLQGEVPDVHLVPVEQRRAEPERQERFHLLRSVTTGAVRAGAAGVLWARDEAAGAATLTVDVVRSQIESMVTLVELMQFYRDVPVRLLELGQRAWSVYRSQRGCTPAGTPPKPRPGGRRIAILVGGFGSQSGHAAVLDVDTAALGYAPGDVAQFSYRGGQATPGLSGVPVHAYDAADSEGDIREASGRLRELLTEVRTAHPGVPVDVIAHSQGGLVVRAALGEGTDHLDPRLPTVSNVITLGTPHHGTEAATANAAFGTSLPGQLIQRAVRTASPGLDGRSTSAGQMAQNADFIDALEDRPLPAGTRVTAIAARGDLTVPALSAQLPGATNAIVRLDGPSAHDRLPGSPEALREMRLAVAGQAPTCRNVLGDVLEAAGVSIGESLLGAGATTVGMGSALAGG